MTTLDFTARCNRRVTLSVYDESTADSLGVALIIGGDVNRLRRMAAILERYRSHFLGSRFCILRRRDGDLCLGFDSSIGVETAKHHASVAYGILIGRGDLS